MTLLRYRNVIFVTLNTRIWEVGRLVFYRYIRASSSEIPLQKKSFVEDIIVELCLAPLECELLYITFQYCSQSKTGTKMELACHSRVSSDPAHLPAATGAVSAVEEVQEGYCRCGDRASQSPSGTGTSGGTWYC